MAADKKMLKEKTIEIRFPSLKEMTHPAISWNRWRLPHFLGIVEQHDAIDLRPDWLRVKLGLARPQCWRISQKATKPGTRLGLGSHRIRLLLPRAYFWSASPSCTLGFIWLLIYIIVGFNRLVWATTKLWPANLNWHFITWSSYRPLNLTTLSVLIIWCNYDLLWLNAAKVTYT